MRKMINHRADRIALHEIYDAIGAQTSAERNSVLWGVCEFKEKGFIKSTDIRGVYEVVK